MLRVMILLVGMLMGGVSVADYCSIARLHLNGVSHHTGPGNYNELNLGAGASCEYREGRAWAADAFIDSNRDPSGYVAHEYTIRSNSRAGFGVMVGLMHRRKAVAVLVPFALPFAYVDAGPVRIQGYVTPPLNEQTGVVFAAQIRMAL